MAVHCADAGGRGEEDGNRSWGQVDVTVWGDGLRVRFDREAKNHTNRKEESKDRKILAQRHARHPGLSGQS